MQSVRSLMVTEQRLGASREKRYSTRLGDYLGFLGEGPVAD